MIVNFQLQAFAAFEKLFAILILYFCLCFFIKIYYDVGDVVTMVSNFCVLSGLDSDKRRIINLGNFSENLCLARPRFPMHQNVRGAH